MPTVLHLNVCCSIEPIHTVIIDCSPIGFMDAVGVKTLQQVRELELGWWHDVILHK